MDLTRKVQVIVQDGGFRDALYFPEGQVPDEKALAALAQARVDAWKARVTAPPRELTQGEKDAQLEFAVAEADRLTKEIAAAAPAKVTAARVKLGLEAAVEVKSR